MSQCTELWKVLAENLHKAEKLVADFDSSVDDVGEIEIIVGQLSDSLDVFFSADRQEVSPSDAADVFSRLKSLEQGLILLKSDTLSKMAGINKGQRGINAYKKV